jgi:hypothetical protein
VAVAPNFLLQFNGDVAQHDVDLCFAEVGSKRPKLRPPLKIPHTSFLIFMLVGLVAEIAVAVEKQHPRHFATFTIPIVGP